jgi:hypothetical protein
LGHSNAADTFAGPSERASELPSEAGEASEASTKYGSSEDKEWFIWMLRLGEGGINQ